MVDQVFDDKMLKDLAVEVGIKTTRPISRLVNVALAYLAKNVEAGAFAEVKPSAPEIAKKAVARLVAEAKS